MSLMHLWGKFWLTTGGSDAKVRQLKKNGNFEFCLLLETAKYVGYIRASGKAKLVGNRKPYEQLKSMLVHFDLGFEIMPGTGTKDLTPQQKPFEQEEPARSDGG